jgi:seryl-tRNA synthetase
VVSTGVNVDDTVLRYELDSIDRRLSENREECIKCRAEKERDIMHLQEGYKELKFDMNDIKASLKHLTEQVNGITLRISIIVAVTVFLMQLVLPFILGKIL